MRTLGSRKEDLASAIANTNQTATAIAAESRSLDEALRELPTTIRRGNTTFVNLRSTLDDLDRLVDASKPATRRLAPFLRELRPLVNDARPTIAGLRAAVRSPGDANDLVDATLRLPRLQRTAEAALRNSTRALEATQPVLAFYRPYAPDLVGFLADFGQTTANYDANGHYARVAPVSNVFRYVDEGPGGRLEFQGYGQRLAQLDQGNLERCPGAASQLAEDGSNNWAAGLPEGGCDPSQVPEGP
jgi:phospholipid/cholesterol/gamma-HCH transport system substrate-binding protein